MQLAMMPELELRSMMSHALELTQALLALAVILGTLGLLIAGHVIPSEWWTVTGLVVGYYFGQRRVIGSDGRIVAGVVGAIAITTLLVLTRVST